MNRDLIKNHLAKLTAIFVNSKYELIVLVSTIKIIKDNEEYWFDYNGFLHRDNAPAIINSISISYYQHGLRHRLDGPACIWHDGDETWFTDGELHRIDGPAVDSTNVNRKKWYIKGSEINCNNNQEFLRIVNMKALL
jgi:hypothetical protein